MIPRKSIGRSLVDDEGFLHFPEPNYERLKKKKETNINAIKELKKESHLFTDARVLELRKFEKDMEDLKLLNRIEKNKKHIEFLENTDKELKEFLVNK